MSFTEEEFERLQDRDFLLSKRTLLEKIEHDFLVLGTEIRKHFYNSHSIQGSAKVSKGENYLGLPYVVLDSPRIQNKKDILTYRHIFWWGNFVSINLLISGIHFEKIKEKIANELSNELFKEFYLCVNTSPWIHHFEKDNMLHLSSLSKQDISKYLHTMDFLKLGIKIGLKDYSNLSNHTISFIKSTSSLFEK